MNKIRVWWLLLWSKPYDFDEASRDQEAVMNSYRAAGVFKDESETGILHLFFSPVRVPRGLTKTMVRVCILLYPLCNTERGIYSKIENMTTPSIQMWPYGLKVRWRWQFYYAVFRWLIKLAKYDFDCKGYHHPQP